MEDINNNISPAAEQTQENGDTQSIENSEANAGAAGEAAGAAKSETQPKGGKPATAKTSKKKAEESIEPGVAPEEKEPSPFKLSKAELTSIADKLGADELWENTKGEVFTQENLANLSENGKKANIKKHSF